MNNSFDLATQSGRYSLVISLLIVSFVTYRMLGERRFKLRSLWILPTVLLLVSAVNLWSGVRGSVMATLLALGGAVLGWLVGELNLQSQRVRLDPQHPGAVWVRSSTVNLVIFLGSFVARVLVQILVGQHALHGALGGLSGALLAFGVALIVVRNYGVYRAARRLRSGRTVQT